MGRPKRREIYDDFDQVLTDLPEAARWREWMGRVEAVIFAARNPVPREALARLVGSTCNLDDLIADIREDLRARPYELVFVAGGYRLVTRPRFASAIRAASGDDLRHAGAPELTPTEILAVTAIAYLQPATRGDLSRLAGREISRDVIGALKRHGLIDGALRAPEPGAPFAYVTTRKFLEVFGLATLRDLPDIERLEDEGLLSWPQPESNLDDAFSLLDNDEVVDPDEAERDDVAEEDDPSSRCELQAGVAPELSHGAIAEKLCEASATTRATNQLTASVAVFVQDPRASALVSERSFRVFTGSPAVSCSSSLRD